MRIVGGAGKLVDLTVCDVARNWGGWEVGYREGLPEATKHQWERFGLCFSPKTESIFKHILLSLRLSAFPFSAVSPGDKSRWLGMGSPTSPDEGNKVQGFVIEQASFA